MALVTIIRSDERHRMDTDWLTTYWHFSFSQYYDPNNMHWGALRVLNDDWIQAGSGIVHSEYNASPDTLLHLLQMWLFPNRRGLTPSWEQKQFTREQRQGKLLPVVSGSGEGGTLAINQSATFYVSSLSQGDTVTHCLGDDRQGYLFVVAGEVALNGQTLRAGDQARIKNEAKLSITAGATTELVLWDSI